MQVLPPLRRVQATPTDAPAAAATAPVKNYVLLATSNPHKRLEYARHLELYGLEVHTAAPDAFDAAVSVWRASEAHEAGAAASQAGAAALRDKRCVGVLRDAAALLRPPRRGDAATVAATEADACSWRAAPLDVVGPAEFRVELRVRMRGRAEDVRVYTAVHRGFVNPRLRAAAPLVLGFGGVVVSAETGHELPERGAAAAVADPVFGFDDIFVGAETGQTMHERRDAMGGKVTSRDAVIAAFIAEHLVKSRAWLAHAPASFPQPSETVDFSVDPASFVAEHGVLAWGARIPGVRGVLTEVLNSGVFFRAGSTRRERNYWFAGGNAGLPLVRKRDAVHEATYFMHDLGHHLPALSDLVLVRTPFGASDALAGRLYAARRMMSEAVTMVLADVLFVEGLRVVGGLTYDWRARAIWPLFEAARDGTHQRLLRGELCCVDGVDAVRYTLNLPLLVRMLHANVRYVLLGDEAPWRALVGSSPRGAAAWEAFKRKYAPYFVADWDWTVSNAAFMQAHGADLGRDWWPAVQGAQARVLGCAALMDTDAMRDLLGAGEGETPSDFVEALWTWTRDALLPLLTEPTPAEPADDAAALELPAAFAAAARLPLQPRPQRLLRAATRYLTCQLALVTKYAPQVPGPAAAVLRAVLDGLDAAADRGGMDDDGLDALRGVHEQFLELLRARSYITAADVHTYRASFPFFEPTFVTYDAAPERYDQLAAVAAAALTPLDDEE
jgi:hypothetical protein